MLEDRGCICSTSVSREILVFQKVLFSQPVQPVQGYTPIKDFSQFATAQSSAATKPDQPELPPVVDV